MQIKARWLFAIVFALFTAPAVSQDVVGKWGATVDTPQGPFAFVLSFSVDPSGKVTGSMQNDFIGTVPLKDPVLKGNEVSFSVKLEGNPDGPVTISYKGTVNGDALVITSKLEGAAGAGGGEQTFTARRTQ